MFANYKNESRVFLFSTLFSLLSYLLYYYLLNPGCDYDTVVAGKDFNKLFNHYLIDQEGFGSVPKLLAVFFSGLSWKIFHSFIPLVVLTASLNAVAVGAVCAWVDREKGIWTISLGFLVSFIYYSKLVVVCDTVAVQTPLVVIGLYLAFGLKRHLTGLSILFFASLFRQGPEVILLMMSGWYFWKGANKTAALLALVFILAGALHALFGFKLFYSTKELFIDQTWGPHHSDYYSYRFNPLKVTIFFLSELMKCLKENYFLVLWIPAALGFWYSLRQRAFISWLALAIFSSSMVAAGLFVEGLWNGSQHKYFMSWVFFLSAFAGMIPFKELGGQSNLFNRILKTASVLFLILASSMTIATIIKMYRVPHTPHEKFLIHFNVNPYRKPLISKEIDQFISNSKRSRVDFQIQGRRNNDFLVLEHGQQIKSISMIKHLQNPNGEDYQIRSTNIGIEVTQQFISANVDSLRNLALDSKKNLLRQPSNFVYVKSNEIVKMEYVHEQILLKSIVLKNTNEELTVYLFEQEFLKSIELQNALNYRFVTNLSYPFDVILLPKFHEKNLLTSSSF